MYFSRRLLTWNYHCARSSTRHSPEFKMPGIKRQICPLLVYPDPSVYFGCSRSGPHSVNTCPAVTHWGCPKWHPNPCIVHSFRPEPHGPWSKVMKYIGNTVGCHLGCKPWVSCIPRKLWLLKTFTVTPTYQRRSCCFVCSCLCFGDKRFSHSQLVVNVWAMSVDRFPAISLTKVKGGVNKNTWQPSSLELKNKARTK